MIINFKEALSGSCTVLNKTLEDHSISPFPGQPYYFPFFLAAENLAPIPLRK